MLPTATVTGKLCQRDVRDGGRVGGMEGRGGRKGEGRRGREMEGEEKGKRERERERESTQAS